MLNLKDKVEILGLLQKGYTVSSLSKKYGVAKATASSIKKNKQKRGN